MLMSNKSVSYCLAVLLAISVVLCPCVVSAMSTSSNHDNHHEDHNHHTEQTHSQEVDCLDSCDGKSQPALFASSAFSSEGEAPFTDSDNFFVALYVSSQNHCCRRGADALLYDPPRFIHDTPTTRFDRLLD